LQGLIQESSGRMKTR